MDYIERHTLILDNQANAARDHMANERTFLAWMRTSFLMVTVGIAFMQMYSIQTRARVAIYDGKEHNLGNDAAVDSLQQIGRPLGLLTAVFALVMMIFALIRYMSTQRELRQRKFPATRVMAMIVVLLSTAVLALILAAEIKSA